MNQVYSYKNKLFSKKNIALLTIWFVLGLWCWYMLWASSLSHRTVLMKFVPEWMTYITTGSVVGVICAGRAAYWRPVGKTPKYVLEMFFCGFCFGFVCVLNVFDVYVYTFSDKLINYESEYEVVFPGPAVGKFSRCEAGLWIKDLHTNSWMQLCTNKKNLYLNRKQGMDRVWVTARVNDLGSYIIDYKFIYR
jgi:hypothetical protein